MGVIVFKTFEPDQIKISARDGSPLFPGNAFDFQTEFDVRQDSAPGQQAELLEHHTTIPAGTRYRTIFDQHFPSIACE